MGEWLELLRKQYNYRLAERFNGWEQNRFPSDEAGLYPGKVYPSAQDWAGQAHPTPSFAGRLRD
jgi:hypothetical protein